MVSGDTPVTSPRRMPATSAMPTRWVASNWASQSDRPAAE